jgi:dethiobiotin synthetase
MQRHTTPKGLFVTATDYGQGATFITAALAKICSDHGLKTAVITPVETGVIDPSTPGPAGTLLKWAAQSSQSDNDICAYRFVADLDPAPAASQAKSKIEFNSLIQKIQQTIAENDFTLIDGSGGLMVPLAGGLLMADLASMIKLPLIVCSSPHKGTVNHTLMSLLTARQLELNIAGYLINNMPAEKSLSDEKLPHTLAVMTVDELLGILPTVSGSDQDKVSQLASEINTMKTFSLLAPFLPIPVT